MDVIRLSDDDFELDEKKSAGKDGGAKENASKNKVVKKRTVKKKAPNTKEVKEKDLQSEGKEGGGKNEKAPKKNDSNAVNGGNVSDTAKNDDASDLKKKRKRRRRKESSEGERDQVLEKKEENKEIGDSDKEELNDIPKEKSGFWKRFGIGAACFFGVILFVYVVGWGYFQGHFMPNTTINEVDFSWKSVKSVEKHFEKQVEDYILTVEENGDVTEYIKGSDISLIYKPSGQLKELAKKQNSIFWIQSLWSKQEKHADVGVTYDEAALNQLIGQLKMSDQSKWTTSTNAYPEFNGIEYVIKPEVYGTALDVEKTKKAIGDAISQFQHKVNMLEQHVYVEPTYTERSEKLQEAVKAMNKYLQAKVTYNMNPDTIEVNNSVIADWVTFQESDATVSLDKEKIKTYMADMAKKYDTVGTSRTFTTANGRQATVSGGTYGWSIDEKAEAEALIASIEAGEVVEREPVYAQTAKTHETADWGNTYAEVDLSNQHMWYVRDGQIIMEADIVSGLPIPSKITPEGVYSCLEKLRNTILKGDIQPDGKREYETPVAYWMRVTWNGVGFHTATWQPYFGGTRYQTNGSHGCINMSYSDSENLFGMIQVGDPVIIHY